MAKVESKHFVFKQMFLILEVRSERNVMAWENQSLKFNQGLGLSVKSELSKGKCLVNYKAGQGSILNEDTCYLK